MSSPYAIYIIAIDQGDYFQQRGGFDWGRSGPAGATQYDSVAAAEAAIRTFGIDRLGAKAVGYDPGA